MKKKIIYFSIALYVGVILYSFSFYNYLLFHITVELFTVIIGSLIFSISSISKKYNQSSFLVILGPGIFAVSLLTFLHALTYKGMNIIPGYDANLPTQLWLLINYILAAAILTAFLREHKKTDYNLLVVIYLVIGSAAAILCFYRIFPTSYIEGTGLTLFKKISEYLIILVFAFNIFYLYKTKRRYSRKVFNTLMVVLVLFIAAEMMFTLYTGVSGFYNFAGHYIRLIAFFMIYKSIVIEGIQKPYKTIFAELHELSSRDSLTHLYNNRIFYKGLEEHIELSISHNINLFLAMIDIDDFKHINDTYGHLVGDAVLVEIAKIIKKNIRNVDIASRQGGDEFSLVLFDLQQDNVENIIQNLRETFASTELTEEKITVRLSGGVVMHHGGDALELIRRADKLLYKAKKDGGNKFYFEFD
ncbi:MAG: sensor domain-containing diguanylate cyclase [Saccharofermentanales bacterium]